VWCDCGFFVAFGMGRGRSFIRYTRGEEKRGAGDCACYGHYRQPALPRGVTLMASISIIALPGWGNFLSHGPVLLAPLRRLRKVWRCAWSSPCIAWHTSCVDTPAPPLSPRPTPCATGARRRTLRRPPCRRVGLCRGTQHYPRVPLGEFRLPLGERVRSPRGLVQVVCTEERAYVPVLSPL
jgi:hypothetical protein